MNFQNRELESTSPKRKLRTLHGMVLLLFRPTTHRTGTFSVFLFLGNKLNARLLPAAKHMHGIFHQGECMNASATQSRCYNNKSHALRKGSTERCYYQQSSICANLKGEHLNINHKRKTWSAGTSI